MPAAAILAQPIPVTAPVGDTKPAGRAAATDSPSVFAEMVSTVEAGADEPAPGPSTRAPAAALHPHPTTRRLTTEAEDAPPLAAPPAVVADEASDENPAKEATASNAEVLPADVAQDAEAPAATLVPVPMQPVPALVTALQGGATSAAAAAARSVDLETPQDASESSEAADQPEAEAEALSPQLASALAAKAAPLKAAPVNASTNSQGAVSAATTAASTPSDAAQASATSDSASPTAPATPAASTPASPPAASASAPQQAGAAQTLLAEAPLQSDAPAQNLGSTAPPPASAAQPPSVVTPSVSQMSQVAMDTTVQIAAQITRKLEGRSTRFEMGLTPEGLGRVNISLDIDSGGKLTARLAFDNPLAATEMRGKADELRRELQDAGFTIANDGLEFSDRESSPGGGFDRRQGQAFAGASRINADADLTQPAPAAWMSLTLRPRGVDMKV